MRQFGSWQDEEGRIVAVTLKWQRQPRGQELCLTLPMRGNGHLGRRCVCPCDSSPRYLVLTSFERRPWNTPILLMRVLSNAVCKRGSWSSLMFLSYTNLFWNGRWFIILILKHERHNLGGLLEMGKHTRPKRFSIIHELGSLLIFVMLTWKKQRLIT